MPLRHGPIRAYCLLTIALTACDRGAPLDVNESALYGSVEIDLRALQGARVNGTQQTCVSILAQAGLRVGAQGGTPRDLRRDVPVGAATIRFDSIQVEQGLVQFAANITSNNGTVLYSKDTSVQIAATTFSLPMALEKRAPVLLVCPGHATLDPSDSFAITVSNRGIGLLTYELALPDCQGSPCIGFATPPEGIDAGGSSVLHAGLLRTAPQASLELRVQSPEGAVPVAVDLPQLPELVVAELEVTGKPQVDEQGDVELPVRVVIRNDGNVPAGIFKVAAEFADQGKIDFFATPFVVPGQASLFYPVTGTPLDPGGEVTFEGNIVFTFARGHDITLRVEADSCSGEEFTPDYCHVDEFNDTNNLSTAIVVRLP